MQGNDSVVDEGALTLAGTLKVQVIYAQPHSVWVRDLAIAPGATLLQALHAADFFHCFPDYPADTLKVGIFGRLCLPDYPLCDGDRVEVYRPLVFDPMESRRRRAAHKRSAMNRPAARRRKKRTTDVSV